MAAQAYVSSKHTARPQNTKGLFYEDIIQNISKIADRYVKWHLNDQMDFAGLLNDLFAEHETMTNLYMRSENLYLQPTNGDRDQLISLRSRLE